MLDNVYEIWSAGNGYIYLYSEDTVLSNLLRKITRNFGRYERNGKVFAWQFLLPKDKLEFIKSEINKKISVEK